MQYVFALYWEVHPLSQNIPTPHIDAPPHAFAETVLMPGDPKRSRFIAENLLEKAKLVNDVRGVQGYTGMYHGKRVSVMASGMGMPAIGIYSHELFTFYGVENIIRVGTAGAISPRVGMRDIVAGMSCCTESTFGFQYGFPGSIAPTASFTLLRRAADTAARLGIRLHIGPLYCSDVFYQEHARNEEALQKLGVIAAEMESAALYLNAMRAGKSALCLCTVVDNPHTGEHATAEDREKSLSDMLTLALEMA